MTLRDLRFHSRRWMLLLAAGAALLQPLLPALAQAQSPATKLLPIESFFEDPSLSAAQLSPDGRTLAMLVGAKGMRVRLGVLDLQTMKPAVVAHYADDDVGQFQWASPTRLVFDLGWGSLSAVDRDGRNRRQLVDHSLRQSQSVGATAQPWNTFLLRTLGDSDDVLVLAPQEISREKVDYIELRRLNTRTGRAEDIGAPLHAFGWVTDAQGQLRAVSTRLNNRIGIHLRNDKGGWKQVLEFENMAAKAVAW